MITQLSLFTAGVSSRIMGGVKPPGPCCVSVSALGVPRVYSVSALHQTPSPSEITLPLNVQT